VPGRHRRLHEAPGQGAIELLPAQWYCQGEPFQQERHKLFAPAWQLLGRAAHLRKPGDYLCANLAGWPLFALVNGEGKPAAFHNVCRHQRMGVVEIGAGNAPALRCKYHGWTYGLDGQFISAPEVVAPADPSSAEHHLERVSLAIWHGLVFVSVTASAESPVTFLAARAIDESRFSGESTTDINCNWKLYIEHCLAADAGSWAWPALIVTSGADGSVVQQVIPRSFSRTRIVQHSFGAAARDLAPAKAACEDAQRRAEAGQLSPAANAAVAAFRERVRSTVQAS
jgi:nitrite reductase/ring-hydroxylating ferredoxin subunit